MTLTEGSSKFQLGQMVMTSGIAAEIEANPAFRRHVLESLARHVTGDWGDLCNEDKQENEYSLTRHLRLLSSYEEDGFKKIWIITEADRSATTVLFPEEY